MYLLPNLGLGLPHKCGGLGTEIYVFGKGELACRYLCLSETSSRLLGRGLSRLCGECSCAPRGSQVSWNQAHAGLLRLHSCDAVLHGYRHLCQG